MNTARKQKDWTRQGGFAGSSRQGTRSEAGPRLLCLAGETKRDSLGCLGVLTKEHIKWQLKALRSSGGDQLRPVTLWDPPPDLPPLNSRYGNLSIIRRDRLGRSSKTAELFNNNFCWGGSAHVDHPMSIDAFIREMRTTVNVECVNVFRVKGKA